MTKALQQNISAHNSCSAAEKVVAPATAEVMPTVYRQLERISLPHIAVAVSSPVHIHQLIFFLLLLFIFNVIIILLCFIIIIIYLFSFAIIVGRIGLLPISRAFKFFQLFITITCID